MADWFSQQSFWFLLKVTTNLATTWTERDPLVIYSCSWPSYQLEATISFLNYCSCSVSLSKFNSTLILAKLCGHQGNLQFVAQLWRHRRLVAQCFEYSRRKQSKYFDPTRWTGALEWSRYGKHILFSFDSIFQEFHIISIVINVGFPYGN